MSLFARSAAILLFALTTVSVFAQERYSKISIPFSSREDIVQIARLGISLEGAARKPGPCLELFVEDHERQLLERQGIAYTVLIPDWNAYYAERQRMESLTITKVSVPTRVNNFHLGSNGGALTLAELRVELDSMRSKYPALISARDSIGRTYQGRPLWAVRIRGTSNPGSQPEALYMGCHHANEQFGMMCLIYYMWYLLENYATDPEVTMLLDKRELWFIPIVNPDGYAYNEETNPKGGGMWRKNRVPTYISGTYGVDINRNYGYKWGYDDVGSSVVPSSNNYRGPSSFSELEAQAVRDFMIAHHFTVVHSFHMYGDFILPPWGYNASETPDSVLFRRLASDMALFNRYTYGTDIYPATNGDACDWIYGDTLSKGRAYAYTVEVGSHFDGEWPTTPRIYAIVDENLRTNLVLAHAAGAYVRVDKPAVSCRFSTDSASISIPFVNSGAGAPPPTLDITVSSPDLDIATTRYSGYVWSSAGPLTIVARKNKTVGANASLAVHIEHPGGATTDTVTFRLGPADTIYADGAEGTRSRWKSASNRSAKWDTTSLLAHSGRLSFAESPTGNYPDQLISSLTLDSTLVLAGVAAELRFWLNGWSEPNCDCLLVELSTDRGATWNALKGQHTSPGSGIPTEVPFETPVLDGHLHEWTEEIMDISQFIGYSVQIRFRFTSDGAVTEDGFYLDDLAVVSYGSLSYAHGFVVAPLTLKKDQDTLQILGTVENPKGHALIIRALSYDLITGKMEDSISLFDDGIHGDGLSNDRIWGGRSVPRSEGVYSVKVTVDDRAEGTFCELPDAGAYATAGPLKTTGFSYAGSYGDTIPAPGALVYVRIAVQNRGAMVSIPHVTGRLRVVQADDQADGTILVWPTLVPGDTVYYSNPIGIYFSQGHAPGSTASFALDLSVSGRIFWYDTISVVLTGVNDNNEQRPISYALEQNFPNPFNPVTTIRYALPTASHVTLHVYDILGEKVATLVDATQGAGYRAVEFDASQFASGIYLYRLQADNFVDVKKLVVLK